jgi:hypothetical protein
MLPDFDKLLKIQKKTGIKKGSVLKKGQNSLLIVKIAVGLNQLPSV